MPLSSVRFLESSSGTVSSELLGLASSGVRDHEHLVVGDEELLHLSLGLLVLVPLSVGNDGLGDGSSDGHSLVHGTSTSDSDSDGEVLEFVGAEDEEGLVDLQIGTSQ